MRQLVRWLRYRWHRDLLASNDRQRDEDRLTRLTVLMALDGISKRLDAIERKLGGYRT